MPRWAPLVILLAGCAVPVPPSGGPPDTTPPHLVSTEPLDGQVGVSTDRVRLAFDEYVDQRSVAAALSITPAPSLPPLVRYGGRSLDIVFRAPLRDSTTYIVVLDAGFRDAHGVALDTPVRLAFSTGPEIDRGRLAGRVVEWKRGRAAAGVDVYAYDAPGGNAPEVLPDEPAHRTQTDREGAFTFEYLPRRPFHVVALRDLNRNRRVDPGEWLAPPPVEALEADTTAIDPGVPWVLSALDAEPPGLRRVEALPDGRLQARFTEPVLPADPDGSGFEVADSLGGARFAVLRAWTVPRDPRSVFLLTAPLPPGTYRLRAEGAVADTSGNVLLEGSASFHAADRSDSLRVRLLGLGADSLTVGADGSVVLAPWAAPLVRFDASPGREALRGAVSALDTTGSAVPFTLDSEDGLTWRVVAEPAGPAFDVTVSIDSILTRRFRPPPNALLGEIAGIATPDTLLRVTLVPESRPSEPERTAAPDADGRYRFVRLPGGATYRLRAFRDLDGDGEWSAGGTGPYDRPEPITWLDRTVTVRARWETVAGDTLRIGGRERPR